MQPDPTHELTDDELADLARLVDGTLPAGRRAEVEARVAASPALSRAVERQGLAVDALRATADTGAPVRLRAHVDRRRSGRPARSRTAVGGAIAAAAALALVVLLVLPSTFSGGPSVADAAALAQKPPTGPAPPGVPGRPQLLLARVGDVPFPDYAAKFGWKPVGVRVDAPAGRPATTVFYEKGRRRIAYTIVSGDALDPPSDARSITRDGVEYHAFRHDGRPVVTWERGGHTCVLSGTAVPAPELVALANWRGKGAIPF
jgi:hypothetical protein